MPPISSTISRTSAIYLGVLGLALLFASDLLLPRVIPGFPREAAWLGQLLAAAWLGAATLNWHGRATVLGGVYGRPLLGLNLTLYVVGALALARVDAVSPLLWLVKGPMSLLGLVYGALLLRGPFDGEQNFNASGGRPV
jgi:hypothetical protein